jgi:hypothetical protein
MHTACFWMVSSLANFYTLKMETVYSSEIFVDFCETTGHCIAEDKTLHMEFCLDIGNKLTCKSFMKYFVFLCLRYDGAVDI